MMKTKWLLTLVAASLFALSASAGAAEVAIDYPGFESPPQGEGGWVYGADGWTQIGTNVGGVWNPGDDAYGSNAPEGQQVAWLEPGGLAQVLTETLTADSTYTLSVQVGNSTYYTSGDYVIELRAGGTVLADFGENAETNITDDTFDLRTVTYTYDPADAALLGEPLEIRLVVTAGGEVDFDDVKLDALRCLSMDPSPADGATVAPASDLLLTWTNRDPNFPGQSVYVDVWFGTDPNHPSPNYTKVVDAGENTTSVPVDASVDGTYYWQVNSYIYGSPTGDPCEGCVFTFNAVSDLPPTVDAGADMITWSGEPVPLDPTVVDDGVSPLTYLWTAVSNDGVSWPDGANVRDPNVTIDKSGFLTTLVLNPGFESPELGDGEYTYAVSDWLEGWYDLTNPGVWTGYSYSAGCYNPDAATYGYEAPTGENVAFTTSYVGYDMGLSQILSVALQADTQYVLSAKVGNPYIYNEGTTNNYRIELVAGDVVLETDTGPAPNGATDPNWFDVSLTHHSGAALTDPNVGQPLEIRLIAVDDGATGWQVDFEDVKLTATPAYPFPAVHTVTVTLALNDEGNPIPVTDTMTIDVYDNACLAAMGKDPTAAKTDLDGNCIANAKDLAAMLATWLVDNSLTAPVVLATTTPSVGSTNAANASIVDGLVEYWELDGDYSAEVDPTHVGTLTTTGTGSGTFVSGKFGQAIDLENSSGNQAYIVIGGDENDFDFAGQSMSVALWYTTESLYTNWQCLVAKGEGSSWRLHRNSNSNYGNTTVDINFHAGGINPTGDGELDQQDGSWHHVVATVDAVNGGKLYVDGSLVDFVSGSVAITGNAAAMQIAGNPGAAGRGWDGILDDVGVWNRALTADEVASIWNGGDGRRIESLFDPNAPDVNAGHDWIILSGQTVTLAPTIVEQVPTDWINLTYLWSADPDTGVVFDPPAANVLAPTVTITKATDNPSSVTLTLAVYGQGKPDPVADTMTIDVYDDACLAAKAAGLVAYDPGDFDENCITDLKDFAAMATEWLVDYTLKEPVAKP